MVLAEKIEHDKSSVTSNKRPLFPSTEKIDDVVYIAKEEKKNKEIIVKKNNELTEKKTDVKFTENFEFEFTPTPEQQDILNWLNKYRENKNDSDKKKILQKIYLNTM